MVMGNHSSGKSTFINWFVDAPIQKVGAALETTGFTIVTAGSQTGRELNGESTMLLYPHLKSLIDRDPRMLSHLVTKTVLPSESFFGKEADLILVFLDPLGQALCNLTCEVVCGLFKKYPSKMRFCLTKVDTVPTDDDLLKVSNQVTQSLTSRLGVIHAFDLLPIFIGEAKTSRVNRLEEVSLAVKQCVEWRVQASLSVLQSDCVLVEAAIRSRLEQDDIAGKKNRKLSDKVNRLYRGAVIVSSVTALVFALAMPGSHPGYSLVPRSVLLDGVCAGMLLMSLVLAIIASLLWRRFQVSNLSVRGRAEVEEELRRVSEDIPRRQRELHVQYLASVGS
ncbi:hypothetical protein Pmar_PMAR022027 [Perkinsus marinus ATCC 50983]|uniref:G domain-containing protein n=1 Tax=Perkinsus marinus (strain ATCC 50983 / TXsc) TaxID=423536 RepID=C5L635_PERM5|nr:hypothetical protein Pmar_PMAR022027 [Perkinsus marinus ATCC 50983]EER07820.1 hypothetical protein Pmar_PMAR022027 [Perkinsus marinus ATCC 50983]|eukprot:XP_002776004.1 hypothetical protein Pmar_PMAR022027 [Perkinsus marinus ATCC 50983]